MTPFLGYLLGIRRFICSLIVIAILLLFAYWALCYRAADLVQLPIQRQAIVVGVVTEVFVSDEGDKNTVYKLSDLTGTVFVITDDSPPSSNSIAVVWGHKAATPNGRAILLEAGRAGASWVE